MSDVENQNPKKGGRPKLKITDYFPQRRSQRKTNKALLAEKQQELVKLVNNGTQDGLKLKYITGKGRGVIATKKFNKDEFVVEYSGELINWKTAKDREDSYAKDPTTGCYMYYFKYKNQQYCIDATKETDRFGRLVNHCRNGNLMTRAIEVESTPRLVLLAKRDIDLNEELSYDYGDRRREVLKFHPWLAN